MAKLTILCLFVVGFSIGVVEALKCLDHKGDPETCRGNDEKCVQILTDGGYFMETPLHWMSFGCSEPCALLDVQDISVVECDECDTDLCNKKKALHTTTTKSDEPTTTSGGGTDPYNGGMANRLPAMAFCLPLVIGGN